MDLHRLFEALIRPFRRRRMRRFARLFPGGDDRLILDIGGTAYNWRLLPAPPRTVLVNLVPLPEQASRTTLPLVADARALPFGDASFEIGFSNSVIEHVGPFAEQQRFAAECRRVARSLFIQTPNKWFVLEPHLLTPFFHWLPGWLQARLIRWFTVRSWLSRPTPEWCRSFLEDTHLLGAGELRRLFPDAEVHKERWLGFAKSLVALRRERSPDDTSTKLRQAD